MAAVRAIAAVSRGVSLVIIQLPYRQRPAASRIVRSLDAIGDLPLDRRRHRRLVNRKICLSSYFVNMIFIIWSDVSIEDLSMPWSPEHKEATRLRILDAAAAALRQHGLDGVSVAEIMKEAGLTHGGFYAHFRSKDDLIAAALRHAGAQSRARVATRLDEQAGEATLLALAESYLSRQHSEHPERGCPLATLGPELARTDGPARQTFAEMTRAHAAWLAERAPGTDDATRERQAVGGLAAMIGGLILARATTKPEDAEHVLATVRAFLGDALGSPARSSRKLRRQAA
jgi:TetR/AcrR family transcriptional repressor of nem operon